MRRLVDELFLMRLERRMSVRRALVYLAVTAVVVGYSARQDFAQWPLFAGDGHAVLSLDIAVARAFCGTLSSMTSDPDVAATVLEQPRLANEPVSVAVSLGAGSLANYCARLTPYTNNENSLMLTEAWLLRAIPGLSLNGLVHVLLALKIAGILLLCFALLLCGAGVAMTVGVAYVGTTLVLAVQVYGGLGVYGFLASLTAAMIAIYGVGIVRSTARAVVPVALLAGVTTAYATNMRTSYLPIWIALFCVYLAAMVLRRTDRVVAKVGALAVVMFVAGYAVFNYWFIARARPSQSESYGYHVIAHPLVLGLAAPPNAFAEREGIEWSDRTGLTLARRVDPNVDYMKQGYDRALFQYYLRLWQQHPVEMLRIYINKWRVAGVFMMEKAWFARPGLDAALWPWRLLPTGFWFLLLFIGSAVLCGVLYRRTNAPMFMMMTMAGVAGVALQGEAAIIMPGYVLKYDQTLLFMCALLSLIGAQAALSVAVAAAADAWTGQRDSAAGRGLLRSRCLRALDEIFVMRLERHLSVRRALAYLAVIGVAVWSANRQELAQPPQFVKDAHAELSLNLAVDRAFCGTPSSITRNPDVAGILMTEPHLAGQSVSSLLATRAGSVAEYCARAQEPYGNNENSLMLTDAWLLRAIPGLSLNGLGRILLAVKIGGLLLLCYALLQCGAPVAMVAAMASAGTSLVLAVHAFGGFGVYGFLASLIAVTIGMYGVGLVHSTARSAAPWALLAGVVTAYAANMRSSYLPIWVLMFGVSVAALMWRRIGALDIRRAAFAAALFATGYLAFHYWFIIRTRPPQVTSYSYHVIGHPLVLSLAVPPNPLATREGIEWSDGIGLSLARRVDPAVKYMGEGYDRALFQYYMRLWRQYPSEMRQIYLDKWRAAGAALMQKASFERPVLDATLAPWKQLPSGFWFLALFVSSIALGGVLYTRTRAPLFVLVILTGIAGLCLLTEAAVIMPSYALIYHQSLLFVCALLTLIGAQAVVNGVVAVGAAISARQRESSTAPGGGAAPSLGERTIADFGEQWSAYTDNNGFYGSPAILQDVFGPLLNVGDLKGAVVVDVGAGTGRFTNVFVSTGVARVVAVEPSRAFDALTKNTAAHRDRVECVHTAVEQFKASNPVDFAFSYGVLHHIPDPRCAVAAMREALKPGGRIGIWLYGREGNEAYVALLTLLTLVTRRLPHAWLKSCVWMVYVPAVVYTWLCRILPLPMRHYFVDIFSKLSPDKRRLTLYDQLNPAYAKYYWQQEVRALLQDAGFVDIEVFHRHNYSWTAVAVKP